MMNQMEGSTSKAKAATEGGKKLGMAVAIAAVTLLAACNFGGDHETSHAPLNPAMQGSPQESDHTNTDADDLNGGYGTGTDEGAVKNDNIERTQGSPIKVPAAQDSSATKPSSAAKPSPAAKP